MFKLLVTFSLNQDGQCRYNPANSGATCTGYVDVTQGDEDALKEAVATIGPVSVAIDASPPSFQLYDSGEQFKTLRSRQMQNKRSLGGGAIVMPV